MHSSLLQRLASMRTGDDRLLPNRLHVWKVDLSKAPADPNSCEKILSPDELRRAYGFRFMRDREYFMWAHCALRKILGTYITCPPSRIVFGKGKYGKPFITDNTDLEFNLSHAGDFMALAIALKMPVGVDIERIDDRLEYASLASRYFSDKEQSEIFSLPKEEQLRAFYRCWTRKEAFVKATGKGLGAPLNQFDVPLQHEIPTGQVTVRWEEHKNKTWSLRIVCTDQRYEGAVVACGAIEQCDLFEWDSYEAS